MRHGGLQQLLDTGTAEGKQESQVDRDTIY